MFELHDVWKGEQKVGLRKRWILSGASVSLPSGRKIALLGADRNRNSSVLRLLSGVDEPDRGTLRREGLPCWPFDYNGFSDNGATFRQNANFLAHVYGVDSDEVARIASGLSGVKVVRGKPLKYYLTPERKSLQLGLTLALQFDWYFVDDRLPNAPVETLQAVDAVIADRLKRASVVWATTKPETVEGFCDAGLVLDRGALTFYNDYVEAAEAYRRSVQKAAKRNERKSREAGRRRGSTRRKGKVDTEKPV